MLEGQLLFVKNGSTESVMTVKETFNLYSKQYKDGKRYDLKIYTYSPPKKTFSWQSIRNFKINHASNRLMQLTIALDKETKSKYLVDATSRLLANQRYPSPIAVAAIPMLRHGKLELAYAPLLTKTGKKVTADPTKLQVIYKPIDDILSPDKTVEMLKTMLTSKPKRGKKEPEAIVECETYLLEPMDSSMVLADNLLVK